jgi:Amt family ammonium transporter
MAQVATLRAMWSGAAVTAIVMLGRPATALADGGTINGADTAWMISATALVLMMSIPGLALFYCGMVRKKNVYPDSLRSREKFLAFRGSGDSDGA